MISKVVKSVLFVLALGGVAWAAGSWCTNNYGYKPQLTTQGTTDYTQFNISMDRIDAALAAGGTLIGGPVYATLDAALAAGVTGNILIPAGTQTLSSSADRTALAGANLVFYKGATVVVPTGRTFTINGTLDAGLYQIFSCTGSGAVVLGQQSVDVVHPVWWYSGTGSWTAAIQAAIDCRPAAVPNVVQITGAATCVTGLTIAKDNITIQGPGGHNSAIITFAPTSAATLFKWSNGASLMYKAEIKDLELIGSGTEVKTFLNPVDVDIFTLSNVQVYDDSAVANIGLYCQGRDHFRIEKFTATCQRPIVIGDNPNSTIDLDGAIFREIYLISSLATGKNVEIATGVILSNVYFEPPFHCNMGAYGFYWNDTTSTGASINVGLRGLRAEQPQDDGYAVYIKHNTGLYNLIMDGIYGGLQNGYYLRKVQGEMRACQYTGISAFTAGGFTKGGPYTNGVALDIDTVVGDWLMTNFVNSNAHGGTAVGITIGSGAKRAYRMSRNANSYGYGTSSIELFTTAADLNGSSARTVQAHNGVQSWSYSGTLADDASVTLPILGATCRTGRVWVTAYVAGVGNELLDCMVTSTAYPIRLSSSTTNTDDADTDGDLCLITGSAMIVKNRLGAEADITIRAEWSVTTE
jgi:hypothetical protein